MTVETLHSTRNIRVDHIRPSPYQPREGKEDETIEELVESLSTQGLLQPVAVRLVDEAKGEYECVFGHRRIEAASRLKWAELPAIVLEITDQESADRLLEENLRRLDLTATAKARFLQRYIADFGLTQEQVGERFGMAQETVSNYLRILNVPEEVKALVDEGRLTISHVKELLPLSDWPEAMVKRAASAAAPKGQTASHATPVRDMGSSVRWDREELQRRTKAKAVRVKAKTSKEPSFAKRLLAGLKASDDKKVLYTDPESGLPLMFARVIVDNITLSPVKPVFRQKEYNPQSDSELLKALDKLGLSLHYNEDGPTFDYQQQNRFTYYLSSSLRHQAGKKYKGACPCGGEHVAVRGWGVEKGDPGQPTDFYARNTKTEGAPKTAVYCSEPTKVNIVLAELVKKAHEETQREIAKQNETLTRFYTDVAPTGDARVAAFLVGCATGEFEPAEKALNNPREAWVTVCEYLGDEFTRWRGGRRNEHAGSLQQLVAVVMGEAQTAKPKAKGRGKKEAGNP